MIELEMTDEQFYEFVMNLPNSNQSNRFQDEDNLDDFKESDFIEYEYNNYNDKIKKETINSNHTGIIGIKRRLKKYLKDKNNNNLSSYTKEQINDLELYLAIFEYDIEDIDNTENKNKNKDKEESKKEEKTKNENLSFKIIKKQKMSFKSYPEMAEKLGINPKPTKKEKEEILKQLKEYYNIINHKNHSITLSYITQKEKKNREQKKLGTGRHKLISTSKNSNSFITLTNTEKQKLKEFDIVEIEGVKYNIQSGKIWDNFHYVDDFIVYSIYNIQFNQGNQPTNFKKYIERIFSRIAFIQNFDDDYLELIKNNYFLLEDNNLTHYTYDCFKDFLRARLRKLSEEGYFIIEQKYELSNKQLISIKNKDINNIISPILIKYNLKSYFSIKFLKDNNKQIIIENEINEAIKERYNAIINRITYHISINKNKIEDAFYIYNEYKNNPRAIQEILVLLCEILRAKKHRELNIINYICNCAKTKNKLNLIPPKLKNVYFHLNTYQQIVNDYIVYCNVENKEKGIVSERSYTLTDLKLNRSQIITKLKNNNTSKEEIEEILNNYWDEDNTDCLFHLNELNDIIRYNSQKQFYEEIENIESILADNFGFNSFQEAKTNYLNKLNQKNNTQFEK